MNLTRNELYQNLLDAGYTRGKAEQFLALVDNGDTEAQRRDLKQNRARILEKIHKENRHLDCLDYLFSDLYEENRQ